MTDYMTRTITTATAPGGSGVGKDEDKMSKTSQIEKAIASLEADMKVLTMAITRLRAEQAQKPARVKKAKAVDRFTGLADKQ